MALEGLVDTIVQFVKTHEAWAAPMAFGVAFLESFAGLSIIWPGTAILIGISALLAKSGVGLDVLWPAIIAATAGGSLGYAISYWIGRHYHEDIKTLWPFRNHLESLERGEAFFKKWGALGVFLGHFFGPVRAIIPVVAGMYNVPQWQFQLANISSAAIWAAGVIAPAYFGLQYFLK